MNFDDFSNRSHSYLSSIIQSTSFNLRDSTMFSTITDPYKLGDTDYQIYPFKGITSYLPNPSKSDQPVLYTFFILSPLGSVKETFLDTLEKKKAGKSYNEKVIGDYYLNFVPTYKPFDLLTTSLEAMLVEDFFPGKGYKFTFHLVTVTKDFDFALIYLETGALAKLENSYPAEAKIEFTV